jgi:V/A-type H+/Na+-transporting ATPase subunit G/H
MQDVIQKIIATETEAKTIVETARAEAEQILLDARKIGQDMIERARQEVRIEAERIIEDAVKEAEQEKKKLLARAFGEIEGQIRLDHARRQWAVEGVVRCVCGQQ